MPRRKESLSEPKPTQIEPRTRIAVPVQYPATYAEFLAGIAQINNEVGFPRIEYSLGPLYLDGDPTLARQAWFEKNPYGFGQEQKPWLEKQGKWRRGVRQLKYRDLTLDQDADDWRAFNSLNDAMFNYGTWETDLWGMMSIVGNAEAKDRLLSYGRSLAQRGLEAILRASVKTGSFNGPSLF